MSKLKVAIIVGSNRRESINRKLATALVHLAGDRIDTQFIRIDDLPIYNQDLEGNRPEVVNRFTQEIAASDSLLVITPEHNRSLPAEAVTNPTSGMVSRRFDKSFCNAN